MRSASWSGTILAMATARLSRRTTLLVLVATFVLGNLLCALAPSYQWLLAARIVTAFSHGAFFGIGAVVAAQLAPPARRAEAMALMFAGLTLANILGVPAGTLLGQALGWHATFWAVTVIGLFAMVAIAMLLPPTLAGSAADLIHEVRVLRQPQVLLAMAISVLCSASLFSVFTYIAPLLESVTGMSQRGVDAVLLLFGVGLTAGNLLGGRLADWRLMPSVLAILAALTGVLGVFIVTSRWTVPAAATTVVWAALAFSLVPLMQMRVVGQASAAPNLASTLNQGAFNLGNAVGAWLGGAVIALGARYDFIPGLGSVIALLALGLSTWSWRLDAGLSARSGGAG
jgi:DHA1 family inner membrane transport protein